MNTQDSIHYAGLQLDRASELRKNPDWVAEQWARQDCRVFLLKDDQNLMHWLDFESDPPVCIHHPGSEIEPLISSSSAVVFLGLENNIPLFAVDISNSGQDWRQIVDDKHEFINLREFGWLLSASEAALLSYARGLLYWHRHSGFCSTCGSLTHSQHGGHLKLCSNQLCGRMQFPRTDPAVIMLVEDISEHRAPRCLLARNSRFPSRMMSTLAGFVDPSETLEETVAREVQEECGLNVNNIRYQASQPWPFPSSIMLGFVAEAITTEIKVDGFEIEEAYWFTVNQLKDFGEWGDGGENFCLPRKDSIARFLVESWIETVSA